MTKDDDFKRLVRSRMEKTGESYAAARAQFLGTGEGSPDHEMVKDGMPEWTVEEVTQLLITGGDPERAAAISRAVPDLSPLQVIQLVLTGVSEEYVARGRDLISLVLLLERDGQRP